MLKTFVLLFLAGFLSCSQLSKLPQPKGVKPAEDLVSLSWVRDLDPVYRPGKLPIGLSSPVIDRNKILAGTASGDLLEINATTFQEKIIFKADAPIYSPVLVQGDMYYFGTLSGDLIAWSVAEAKVKFTVNVGAPIETNLSFSEGRIIVPVRSHAVVCVDALTGKVLWSYKRPVAAIKTLQRRSGALVIGKNAIMGFADGYLLSFRIEDGNVQWETKVTEAESRHFQDVVSTPTYFEGRIWVNSYQGYLKAYKLDNGSLDKTILEKPSSNFVVKDGSLYFATILGDLVKLNNKLELSVHFKKLSNQVLYQIHSWGQSFIINDHQGRVYWVDQKVPNLLSKTFFLGHSYSTIFGPIASDQSYLTLISSRNRLYLFQNGEF